MAEYIEREAAMSKFLYSFEKRKIEDIPAADVAPVVHGCWILDSSDEYATHYHCDRCGVEIDLCNEVYTEPTPNYCPNCGAKMARRPPMETKCCGTCLYWDDVYSDDFSDCICPWSINYADSTYFDESCEEWEARQ